MKFTARVWKFGDNINTDLMLPILAFYYTTGADTLRVQGQPARLGGSRAARRYHIGGSNFGTGSSRPAARSLKNLGLGCLVANSINGLFFRNCVNFAFPAMECPGVFDSFSEGDIAEVDFETASVRNKTTNTTVRGIALPPKLLDLLKAGGIYPLLEQEGAISPRSS